MERTPGTGNPTQPEDQTILDELSSELGRGFTILAGAEAIALGALIGSAGVAAISTGTVPGIIGGIFFLGVGTIPFLIGIDLITDGNLESTKDIIEKIKGINKEKD